MQSCLYNKREEILKVINAPILEDFPKIPWAEVELIDVRGMVNKWLMAINSINNFPHKRFKTTFHFEIFKTFYLYISTLFSICATKIVKVRALEGEN